MLSILLKFKNILNPEKNTEKNVSKQTKNKFTGMLYIIYDIYDTMMHILYIIIYIK